MLELKLNNLYSYIMRQAYESIWHSKSRQLPILLFDVKLVHIDVYPLFYTALAADNGELFHYLKKENYWVMVVNSMTENDKGK